MIKFIIVYNFYCVEEFNKVKFYRYKFFISLNSVIKYKVFFLLGVFVKFFYE